jgi:type I restriction enzyme S subunit
MKCLPYAKLGVITSGAAFKSSYFNEEKEGLPLIRCRDINSGFAGVFYSGEYEDRYLVSDKDLLLSMDGDFKVKSWDLGPALLNQRTCRLEPDCEKLDADYLRHFLPKILGEIHSKTAFATVKHLSTKVINSIQVPLPTGPNSLAEQKRIAAILDKADAIRRKRQQALQLTDDFLRSTFLKMFGDPTRSTALTIQSLLTKEILLLHKDGNHGGSYPRASEFGDDGIPFLSAKDIDPSEELRTDQVKRLNEEKARTLRIGWIEKNDVLLAHNATVGPVALYRGNFKEALIGTSLTAFRPDPKKLLPEFLAEALRSSHFQRQLTKAMAQTTRNQVPITAQRNLQLLIPSPKDQLEFLEYSRSHLNYKKKLRNSVKQSENLFKSLQQRAFSGQL